MRYIWRTFGLLGGVFVLLLINSNKVHATSLNAETLYELTNEQRQTAGLDSLSPSHQLEAAARAKAEHMMVNQYWAHFAPDNTAPWEFIKNSGYSYSAAGENLAMDFETAEGTMTGWLNSPSHRENLLDSRFNQIGIAVLDGELLGHQTSLVVAFYAKPKSSIIAPVASVPVVASDNDSGQLNSKQSEIEPGFDDRPPRQSAKTQPKRNWRTGFINLASTIAQLSYRVVTPPAIELIND